MKFLRGNYNIVKKSTQVLGDGQPLYIMDTNQLLIGDGKSTIANLLKSNAQKINPDSQKPIEIWIDTAKLKKYQGERNLFCLGIQAFTSRLSIPIRIDWGDGHTSLSTDAEHWGDSIDLEHLYTSEWGLPLCIKIYNADGLRKSNFIQTPDEDSPKENCVIKYIIPDNITLGEGCISYETADVDNLYDGLKEIVIGNNCILESDCIVLGAGGERKWSPKLPKLTLGANCDLGGFEVDGLFTFEKDGSKFQMYEFSAILVADESINKYNFYGVDFNDGYYYEPLTYITPASNYKDMEKAISQGPAVTMEILMGAGGTLDFSRSWIFRNSLMWVDYGDGTINNMWEHTYSNSSSHKYTVKIYIGDDAECKMQNDVFPPHGGTVENIILHNRCDDIPGLIIPLNGAVIQTWNGDPFKSITLDIAEISSSLVYDAYQIILTKNVRKIRGGTFNSLSHVESIVIPESVEFLGYGAFCNCANLKAIELFDSTELELKDGKSSIYTYDVDDDLKAELKYNDYYYVTINLNNLPYSNFLAKDDNGMIVGGDLNYKYLDTTYIEKINFSNAEKEKSFLSLVGNSSSISKVCVAPKNSAKRRLIQRMQDRPSSIQVDDDLWEYTVNIRYHDPSGDIIASHFSATLISLIQEFLLQKQNNSSFSKLSTDFVTNFVNHQFSLQEDDYQSVRKISFSFVSRNNWVPIRLAANNQWRYDGVTPPGNVEDFSSTVYDTGWFQDYYDDDILSFKKFLLDSFDTKDASLTASGDDIYYANCSNDKIANYISGALARKLVSLLTSLGDNSGVVENIVDTAATVLVNIFTKDGGRALAAKFGIPDAGELKDQFKKLCENILSFEHNDHVQYVIFDRDHTENKNGRDYEDIIRFHGVGSRRVRALNPVGPGEYSGSEDIIAKIKSSPNLEDLVNDQNAEDIQYYKTSWAIDISKHLKDIGIKQTLDVSRRRID